MKKQKKRGSKDRGMTNRKIERKSYKREQNILKSNLIMLDNIVEQPIESLSMCFKHSIYNGDVFLIPARHTGFGKNANSYPWIVKRLERKHDAILCPRTTQVKKCKKEGIFSPIELFAGFKKPGIILINKELRININQLIKYEYLGMAILKKAKNVVKKKKSKKVLKKFPEQTRKSSILDYMLEELLEIQNFSNQRTI